MFVVAVGLVVSITAGVCEELLYRGFLMAHLASFFGTWPAVLSSLAFGIVHAGWMATHFVRRFALGSSCRLRTSLSGSPSISAQLPDRGSSQRTASFGYVSPEYGQVLRRCRSRRAFLFSGAEERAQHGSAYHPFPLTCLMGAPYPLVSKLCRRQP